MYEEFTAFIAQLININICLKKDFVLELIDKFDIPIKKLNYPNNNLDNLSISLNFYKGFNLEYYNIINTYIKAKGFNYEVDVSNEARMHLWKIEHNQGDNVEQYKNSEDAMSKWIATVHAIGITKVNDNIKIYAPYGLSDIYSRTIRPIKHNGNSKELYDKKVASWQNRFDNLNIIEW